MAFFLARVSGSSFQQPPASLGGAPGRGHVGQLLMAAIMVPARADGDAGLTIHGASLRK